MMDKKKELLVRAYLVMLFFVIIALVILYRVFNISILEGEKWRSKGSDHIKLKTIEADRGSIYADDLSLLVTALPFFDIHMDTKVVDAKLFAREVDSLAYGLSLISPTKTKYEWLVELKQAQKEGKQYHRIARNVTADKVEDYKRLPIFRRGQYGGGLILSRKSRREKPFGSFASRTLGEDRDNADKIGLEGYFDRFLKGLEKKRIMKNISNTEPLWVPLQNLDEHDVEKGNDLYTTLNIQLQDITHHALLKAMEKYQAKEGTAIVMEVKTGAIKAITNFGLTSSGQYGEIYNYAIGKSSEPGSTFKLASVLALLDGGHVDLETPVDLGGGKKRFYDKTMYDSKMHGIHRSTLREAFEISSNVGIATLCEKYYGYAVNPQGYVKKLRQFGLCEKTGVEINGEGAPYVKDPDKDKKLWYGTTVPWMSHGYELHLTPLQMLNFYNAVANNGKMMKPYLVSEIRGKLGQVKKFEPKVLISKIASDGAIQAVQELLEGVVLRGTAKNLRSDIVTMAGKTGTTRIGYGEEESIKRYNASFAGYFPAKNPKYSMIVVVYEPQGKFYGSSVAAPVFKEIAEKFTAMDLKMQADIATPEDTRTKGLPGKGVGYKSDFEKIMSYVDLTYKDKSKSAWVDVDPFESRMLIDNKKIKLSEVPDVRGMGARDAAYVLENLGFDVALEGIGKVYMQSLTPGARNQGQKIKIYLN